MFRPARFESIRNEIRGPQAGYQKAKLKLGIRHNSIGAVQIESQ